MKVQVWVDYIDGKASSAEVLWEGEISAFPREGDVISLHEDWCAFKVKRSYYDLPTDSVEITISHLSREDFGQLKRDLHAD